MREDNVLIKLLFLISIMVFTAIMSLYVFNQLMECFVGYYFNLQNIPF